MSDDAPQQTGRPLNARVIKMKRADFEKAVSGGLIEEEQQGGVPDTAPTGKAQVIDPDAILSPEEEADLQRELAEVEAELAQQTAALQAPETIDDGDLEDIAEAPENLEEADAEAVAEDKPDSEIDPVPENKTEKLREIAAALRENFRVSADEEPEEQPEEKPNRGLSRLMGIAKRAPEDEERIFDKADSQMGDKDASLRRTAIQHLRAAVAATRAEKKAGVDVDQRVDETPYRSDIAQVVRPRRPSSASATERPERPSEARPAPLKLVAEQRVDVERAPVRPRRVTSVPAPEAEAPDGGFSAFAEQLGATELSDLLEAAAAYMSDVEGQTEFTRPMLMSKLKEVRHDGYSREDGLRSFGQLLRAGKLRKLKGGRFAATDETEFREEARNAG